MRKYYYSLTAIRNLTELSVIDQEFESLDSQVKALAEKPDLGYALPIHYTDENLFRFDVGRFGLIYMYDKNELNIVAVYPA
jgi:mRNA-degrading endonuclease RelE of RelBE toxin-antitoxin system